MLTHSTTASPPIRAASSGGADAAPRPRPFWKRDQEASLGQRIAAINRINDPAIMTDNVLFWTRLAIWVLLGITGLIGGLNYYKFFSLSIDVPWIVWFLTVAVAAVLEFGKYYCTTWALRDVFFKGFGYIKAEVHSFTIWVGLVLVGLLCLGMSAYNSTKGAEQLAYLLSHQSAEGQAVFTPNTPDLDAQIAASQNAQASALSNRITKGQYKGMVEYNSAKTAKTAGASADALIKQKEQVVAQQRADWERQQQERRQHTDHAAGYILKIGGWIELLQFILMFVRVACERQLANHPQAQPYPTNGPGRSNGAYTAQETHNGLPYNWIGFNRDEHGNVKPYARGENPVSQQPPPVSQFDPPEPLFQVADEILRYYEGELRKEPSHFARRDASAATIVSRIHKKLRLAHSAIDRTQAGAFSIGASQRFGLYLTGVIRPLLEQHLPYEGLDDMLASLRQKTATEGEAAIL